MKFLLYSRGFFEREKTVASRLHTRRTMRFVTRTITIAECKPRGIHYARIYRVFPRGVATQGKEREKEREGGVSGIYSPTFLSFATIISRVTLINHRQPVPNPLGELSAN